jgi:hypothetical protein
MPQSAASQQIDRSEFETWIDVTTTKRVDDRWHYDGDQGFRTLIGEPHWWQLYVRPSVRYEVRPWFRARGGIGLFYSYLDTPSDLFELRPWLGMKFLWPKPAGFVFGHYFRLEERVFYTTGSGEWDTSLRARYQLALRTPSFDVGGATRFYALAYGEIFENTTGGIRDLFVNKTRIGGAIGKNVRRGSRVELDYMYQSTKGNAGEDFTLHEHILRIRLFHDFTGP